MPRPRRAADPAYQRERARLDPFEAIARQVILRRGQLGLTQGELAGRVGTSHSAISRLESGQHRASITTLERVGEALGLRLMVSLDRRRPEPAGLAAPISTESSDGELIAAPPRGAHPPGEGARHRVTTNRDGGEHASHEPGSRAWGSPRDC